MKYPAMLAIGMVALFSAPAAAHTLSVPHPSGEVRAEYSGEIEVEYRQIGSPAPGGRESTLRCEWSAHLVVDRTATNSAGLAASRSFTQADVARGSRAGFCNTSRAAISREAIAAVGDTSQHVALAAQEDRPVLHEELERLSPQTRES